MAGRGRRYPDADPHCMSDVDTGAGNREPVVCDYLLEQLFSRNDVYEVSRYADDAGISV